jgi:hypothetical protein
VPAYKVLTRRRDKKGVMMMILGSGSHLCNDVTLWHVCVVIRMSHNKNNSSLRSNTTKCGIH